MADEETTGWHAHPLTVTILGFALTTGVLTYYEGLVSDREALAAWKVAEQARVDADTARAEEALSHVVTAIQTRALETDMVRSALVRGDPQATQDRKARYDDVFRAWNITMDLDLFAMDETMTLGLQVPSLLDWKTAVTRFVGWGNFRLADSCLTVAYDQARLSDWSPVATGISSACQGPDWDDALRGYASAARACGSEVMIRGTDQLAQLQQAMSRHIETLTQITPDWRADLALQTSGAMGSYITQATEESEPVACKLAKAK